MTNLHTSIHSDVVDKENESDNDEEDQFEEMETTDLHDIDEG